MTYGQMVMTYCYMTPIRWLASNLFHSRKYRVRNLSYFPRAKARFFIISFEIYAKMLGRK